jgi:beta-lactamase regulating signal transducer with metallopeptidase domain
VSLTIFLTRRSTATVRYRIFSSLFFLFLGATIITFILEYSSLRSIPTPALLTGNEIGGTLTLSSNPHSAGDLKVPLPSRLAFYFNAYGPWLMLLWFIVFLLKSIRLGINYAQVQRIRNDNPYFLPDFEKRVNELAKLLRIRRTVKLRETTSVTVPVTIGFLKPLILIPVGLINNLPPDQVEAILLHELAHIRRMDYLVNLVQCLAETIFFFNPAVLWLSSLLREERENCCDDIAITVTQNKSLFIHALVAFQEYHAGHPMAPGLTGSKYPLLKRIQRIVYNTNKNLNHMEKIFLALGLVVTGIVALAFNTPRTHKEKAAQSKVNGVSNPGRIFKDSVPAGNSRSSQKRTDEGLLLEKIAEEKNKLNRTNELEWKLMENNLKKANENDAKAMELFNESKKMDLQDKFMKKLLFDKERQNFLNDKVSKSNEEKLFNEQELFNDQELFKKKMQEAEAQKLYNDINEKILNEEKIFNQDFKLLDEKDKQWLIKDKMEFEKNFNGLPGKMYDTTKPRKAVRPKNPDGDDFESRLQNIQERKKELENELKEKEKEDKADYNERMREMAEYRAMLQKELRQTESRIDREKKNAERARHAQKENRDRLDQREREQEKRQQEGEKRAREMEKRTEENKRKVEMEREKRESIEDEKREAKEREKEIEKEREKSERKESRDRDKRDDKIESKSSSSKENIKIESKDGKEKIDVKIQEKNLNFNSNENRVFNKNGNEKPLFRSQYADLAKERTAQKRADVQQLRKESTDRRNEMIRELKEDDIIPEDANSVNIHIDDDKMIVNGVLQPENVHKKYIGLYRKDPKKIPNPVKPNPANKPKATSLNINGQSSVFTIQPLKVSPSVVLIPAFEVNIHI